MSGFLQRARFGRDHRWAPRQMSEYLDGELARRGRARLERHARHCPDCRWLLGSLRRTIGALQGLPPSGGDGHAVQIAAAVRLRLDEPPAP